MKRLIFATAALLLLTVSCGRRESGSDKPQIEGDHIQPTLEYISEGQMASMASSTIDFAINLFNNVCAEENGNVLLSPLSVSMAMSLTSLGAAGSTYDQIADVLGFKGYTATQVGSFYYNLAKGLTGADNSTVLELANSVWADKTTPVWASFVDYANAFYAAPVEGVNFSSPTAAQKINKWCDDKTHGLVKEVVNDTKDWRVALVNALYFKSPWARQFEATEPGTFNCYDGTKAKVQMLCRMGSMAFSEDLHFKMVQLTYGSEGRFVLDVLLPQYAYDLDIPFLTPDSWRGLAKSISYQDVDLLLPEFELEYGTDLADILPAMGMTDVFNPLVADLSELSSDPELYIDQVIHKTKMNLDENGTEAAAVTVVVAKNDGADLGIEYIKFYVDRPFIFFIRDLSTGTILFAGRKLN